MPGLIFCVPNIPSHMVSLSFGTPSILCQSISVIKLFCGSAVKTCWWIHWREALITYRSHKRTPRIHKSSLRQTQPAPNHLTQTWKELPYLWTPYITSLLLNYVGAPWHSSKLKALWEGTFPPVHSVIWHHSVLSIRHNTRNMIKNVLCHLASQLLLYRVSSHTQIFFPSV